MNDRLFVRDYESAGRNWRLMRTHSILSALMVLQVGCATDVGSRRPMLGDQVEISVAATDDDYRVTIVNTTAKELIFDRSAVKLLAGQGMHDAFGGSKRYVLEPGERLEDIPMRFEKVGVKPADLVALSFRNALHCSDGRTIDVPPILPLRR